ncbi:substrate-binding periplasmic protein [Pseudodesulfovibrio mercurii]|uniref:substrate-binding periplasmic protein n=1 Tax=Pseudodesulfovibrio mercurii TaxID=641491 RepID=UPI0002D82821|nr:transporter substrate-binding domain-containing protein [Pseudodesulfovibrio mercurii]
MFHRRPLSVVVWMLLACACQMHPAVAGDAVTFALFTRGWPPFEMVVDGEPEGAALDIFRASMPDGVGTSVKLIPASRSMLRTPGDDIYTRLECREWIDDADNYLWSGPVLTLRTVLLSRRNRPVEYTDASSLHGLTIGCIKSYSYPEVEPLFRSGKAYRYDVNSDVVLLRMLKAGRVDAALFDQYTVRWIIRKSSELSMADFHVAARPLGSAELRFVFNRHPGWEARLPEIDARIRTNREDGVYERIMDRY